MPSQLSVKRTSRPDHYRIASGRSANETRCNFQVSSADFERVSDLLVGMGVRQHRTGTRRKRSRYTERETLGVRHEFAQPLPAPTPRAVHVQNAMQLSCQAAYSQPCGYHPESFEVAIIAKDRHSIGLDEMGDS